MSTGSENTGLFVVTHLRFKPFWLSLGLLLVCGIVVLSLVDLTPVDGLLLQDKILHVLAYGLLMGWFAQIYTLFRSRILLVITLVALGIGVEYLQGMGGHRQFDTLDMVANSSGVLLAWLLSYTWLGNLFVRFERLLPR